MEETLVADRQDFDGEILTEDVDSVVFFYSTEFINYWQRKIAWQYNVLAHILDHSTMPLRFCKVTLLPFQTTSHPCMI